MQARGMCGVAGLLQRQSSSTQYGDACMLATCVRHVAPVRNFARNVEDSQCVTLRQQTKPQPSKACSVTSAADAIHDVCAARAQQTSASSMAQEAPEPCTEEATLLTGTYCTAT